MFEAGEEVLLSEVTSTLKDGTHGTHERVASGIPLLSAKNITDRGEIAWTPDDDFISEVEYRQIHKHFQLEPGDLLLTIVGSLGRRAVYKGQKVTFQRSVAFIRPQYERVDCNYLFHFFGHPSFTRQLIERSNATAQAGLYLGELAKTKVRWFPLTEQQKIAQILDTLDTQIRQTEALIAKLERIKQGLLTDLLTRGIDQNGQLRPSLEQAPHLYKDSPLGRIPKEWESTCLGNIGEVVTGSTPPSSDPRAWGDALPFFTPGEVVDYEPMRDAERAISDAGRRYIREIPGGSTLVVCIGSTIGKVGFISRSGATNQQINAVLPSEDWDKYFVFQAIRTYVDQILTWAGLQAVPIVNKSTFSKMLIPQPTLEEQRAVSEKLRSVDERISDERTAISKLSKEKNGLMDDLLTGQVRVTPLLEATQRATA